MVYIALCIDAWLFYLAILSFEAYRRASWEARWRALAHRG
jgi:hypothetical protein